MSCRGDAFDHVIAARERQPEWSLPRRLSRDRSGHLHLRRRPAGSDMDDVSPLSMGPQLMSRLPAFPARTTSCAYVRTLELPRDSGQTSDQPVGGPAASG